MKFQLIALVMALSATSLGAIPEASGQPKPSPGNTTKSGKTDEADAAASKPVVRLGMTPEEVAKVIGRPDLVEPVTTPAGKGEQWKYRRLAKQWTQESAATVGMVPAYVGLAMPNDGLGEAESIVHHIENVRIFQVSSLLFADGKLVAAKQWPERESNIGN